MPAPLISVVLPVRDVRDYLAECLGSILGQGGDVEVIAVNDASADGSGQLLDAAAAREDRLRVTHLNRSGGPGHARNVGLQQAAGDYVWFIDGDDMVGAGAVAAISGRLAEHRPDVLLIDYESMHRGGRTEPSPGAGLLRAAPAGTFTLAQQPELIQLTMTSWSKVLSRPFLTGLGVPFPPGIHEDVLVSCAALLEARRISVLDRVCYRYRRDRPGSFMATTSQAHLAIFDAYREVFSYCAKRQAAGTALPPDVQAGLFERAIGHYTALLATGGTGIGPLGSAGLVPRRERRRFFARMHRDFGRYVPPGYRYPPGPRGAKFRLIERGAYRTYELLEPMNKARVAMRRIAAASGVMRLLRPARAGPRPAARGPTPL